MTALPRPYKIGGKSCSRKKRFETDRKPESVMTLNEEKSKKLNKRQQIAANLIGLGSRPSEVAEKHLYPKKQQMAGTRRV